MTIIVVDDEQLFCDMLCMALSNLNITIIGSYNGEDAWKKICQLKPRLVLLDIALPQLGGLELLAKIRNHSELSSTYVIMLTARSSKEDVVFGLESGADDYITKPFELPEFMARVRAGLRRVGTATIVPPEEDFRKTGLFLSENAVAAFVDGQPLPLTPVELDLLEIFINNPHQALSREHLITRVIGYDCESTARTIDTHVNNLRKKISVSKQLRECIVSVRGIGYRFDPPPDYPVRTLLNG